MKLNIEDLMKAKSDGERHDDMKVQEMLDGETKIESNEFGSTIKTEQGDLNIQGRPQQIQINIPRCELCGRIGDKQRPLFTIDGEKYICKPCLIYGFRTMLLNGVNMPTIEEMSNEQEKFDAYKY